MAAYEIGEPLRELPVCSKSYWPEGKWPDLYRIARDYSPDWVPLLNVSAAEGKAICRAFRRPPKLAVGYDAAMRSGVPHIRYVPNVKGLVARAQKKRK